VARRVDRLQDRVDIAAGLDAVELGVDDDELDSQADGVGRDVTVVPLGLGAELGHETDDRDATDRVDPGERPSAATIDVGFAL
jgi:hypothetical protein